MIELLATPVIAGTVIWVIFAFVANELGIEREDRRYVSAGALYGSIAGILEGKASPRHDWPSEVL